MARASDRLASLASRSSRTTASPVTRSDMTRQASGPCSADSLPRWTSTPTSPPTAASGSGWSSCSRSGGSRSRLSGAEVDELVDALPARRDPPVRGALRLARPGSGRPAVHARRAGPLGGDRRAGAGLVATPPASSPSSSRPRSTAARAGGSPSASRSAWSAWSWAAWVAGNPEVQASIAAPEEIRQLVERDFEDYYSSAPAGSFAAQVATNNAWVSALAPGARGAPAAGGLDAVAQRAERRGHRRPDGGRRTGSTCSSG